MTARKLRVLAIEDNEVDAAILERALAKIEGLCVDFMHCADPESIPDYLKDPTVDLVFLDYNLGAIDGLEVLQSIRSSGDPRPVILLTGQGDEYVAARSIRAGADEYIVKSDIEPGAVARVMANAEEESRRARARRNLEGSLDQLEQENEELRWMALFDQLTGLASRRHFQERLTQQIAHAHRYDTSFSLLMLDVDHFKLINDTWGHDMGDQALVRLASTLKDCIRGSDTVARLGGDEFCVVLTDDQEGGAGAWAERFRVALSRAPLVAPDGSRIQIRCSIGIATFDLARDDEATLKARADVHLYEAKRAGRDRVAGQGTLEPPDNPANP